MNKIIGKSRLMGIIFVSGCLTLTVAIILLEKRQTSASKIDPVKINSSVPKENFGSILDAFLINKDLPFFQAVSKNQNGSEGQLSNELETEQLQMDYMQTPIRFEPNLGQVDSSKVKFTAHGSGYSLFLTDTGASFVLRRLNSESLKQSAFSGTPSPRMKIEKTASIEMRLLEAKSLEKTESTEELPSKSNYFIGGDPGKWRTDVPNYGRVRFREVYEGIDLEYYGNQKEIEYDFIVRAGAAPEQIRLKFDGVEKVSVDSQGELVLKTPIGEIRLKKPIIYQEEDGVRQEIAGGYKIDGREVGFWLGEYDQQKTLIIDPIVYTSVFIGGSDFDSAQDISSINYSYTSDFIDYKLQGYTLTGITTSLNFPTTSGVVQANNAGGTDIFVRTFSRKLQSGTVVESASYTTYLGGSGYDAGYGAAMDVDRNVWITGETDSTNFPTTPRGTQRTYGGGVGDAYIVQLSPQGNSLLFSTFHGGSGYDYGFDIGIQNFLDFYYVPSTTGVWLAGGTSSTNFPTIGSFSAQPTYGGGDQDGFVTHISLQQLNRFFPANSGTLGGIPDSPGGPQTPGSPRDVTFTVSGVSGEISNIQIEMSLTHSWVGDVKAVLIAPDGTSHNVFGYTGAVSSTSFGDDSNLGGFYYFNDSATSPPSGGWWQEATARTATQSLTAGGYRTTNSGGAGAANPMPPTSIDAAFSSIASVNGTWTLRITDGAAQDTGSITEAYLSFDTDRNSYSTYLGGGGSDVGKALYVEHYSFNSSFIWVTGSTSSTNFPTTAGAYQRTYGGGASDAFISKYPFGNIGNLSGSTYLGGSGSDSGNGIIFNQVAGVTSSTNFPTTAGAYQRTYGGGASDAFVTWMNNNLESPYASTFLGGSGDDAAHDITHISGNEYFVTGSTSSVNFPTTPDAIQLTKSGGKDAFISKMFFGALRYSTFYGGSNDDWGNSVARGIDDVSSDNALIVGDTSSTNFPTTPGAGQTIYGGGASDGFFITTSQQTVNIQVNVVPGCRDPNCNNMVFPTRVFARRSSDGQEFNAVSGTITVPAGFNYFVTGEGGTLFDGRGVNWTAYSLTNVTTDRSLSFYVQTPTHNVDGILNGLTSTAGVTVTVTDGNIIGSRNADVFMNAQNQVAYSITNLSCTYRYTITPMRNGTVFSSPSNGQTPYIFRDETLNFTATSANPVPAVSSVSPPSLPAGSAGFPLLVNGSDFVNGSIVRWNGQDRPTTYNSANQLVAQIAATDIQTAGTNQVSVFSPEPGGGTSPTSVTFTVNNPPPVMTTISPSSLTVGSSSGFQLIINGSGFVSGAIARWNGQDRATTFVSANQIRAQITASDLLTAGTFPVTVWNPAPGGGLSNAVNFTLNNPVPSVSSLNPDARAAGGAAFELTVNGSGFVNNSTVRWNGQSRTTTFVSAAQLKAQITAADIQTAGAFPVTVFNGSPGGGTSTPFNFTVSNATVSVTVQTDPAGLSVIVDGTTYTSPQTFSNWVSGSSHTIAVGSPQGNSSTRYLWSSWSDGGAVSHTVAPTSNTIYTASFATEHYLTINAGTGGTANPPSGWRTAGAQVQISAVPNSGFLFAGWTGGYTGTDNPANVTVGNPLSVTANFSPQPSPQDAFFDFDGDGKSDISVFRPSENKWYLLRSSDSQIIQTVFAVAGDLPTPADYDGDGKSDISVFRPASGDWWYLSSITGAQVNVRWGQAGDLPRPSDFDGDGKTDFVVYRPSNSVWYRLSGTGQTSIIAFGISEDKPLIGDFDGDGKSDPAVFRPSTGDWWYAGSSSGQFAAVHWGANGDIPAPGDYDGDGKTDFVVFRPSDGGWYILYSTATYTIATFGTIGDKPIAADYDGDGKVDIAVFRPSTGIWYLLQTTAGFGAVQWGVLTDTAIPNAFLP